MILKKWAIADYKSDLFLQKLNFKRPKSDTDSNGEYYNCDSNSKGEYEYDHETSKVSDSNGGPNTPKVTQTVVEH